MSNRLFNFFRLSASFCLIMTGAAKVYSAIVGDADILNRIDPILGISFRALILCIGVAELTVSAVCLMAKTRFVQVYIIAILATNIVIYRLGLWWLDYHKPCSCLGSLTDALHISPELADWLMKLILAYLLIGSYSLSAISYWLERETSRTT